MSVRGSESFLCGGLEVQEQPGGDQVGVVNRRRSASRGLVFYRVLELAMGPQPSPLPGPHRQPAATDGTLDPTGRTRSSPEPDNTSAEQRVRVTSVPLLAGARYGC